MPFVKTVSRRRRRRRCRRRRRRRHRHCSRRRRRCCSRCRCCHTHRGDKRSVSERQVAKHSISLLTIGIE